MEPLRHAPTSKYTPVTYGETTPAQLIEILGINLSLFHTHPMWVEATVNNLEMTDLSKVGMTETGWKTYAMLRRSYPHFFAKPSATTPKIEVQLNQFQRTVPKNHLLTTSWRMRQLVASCEDETLIRIRSEGEGCDESIANDFLDYLVTGKATINHDNAIVLLKLAHYCMMEDLDAKVIDFLKTQITQESLPLYLQMALLLNHPHLSALCLFGVFQLSYLEISAIIAGINQPANSAETLFLERVRFLKDQGFLARMDGEKVRLSCKNENLYDGLTLSALNALCQKSPVLLKLKDIPELDDEKLEGILGRLPDLKHLSISHPIITNIPYIERFETLSCINCTSLTTLTAPIAKFLDCSYCSSLTSITAPVATFVDCLSCERLETIHAPAATDLCCHNCSNLTTITVPQATLTALYGQALPA